MKTAEIVKRFRIDRPAGFRLAAFDPADCCGLDIDKAEVKAVIAADVERLEALQERLHAQDRWAVLTIFQGMDASGKDSVIKHVMSGINPQGVQVVSFKAPSEEERDHDFLWRVARRLPERGRIGIFNRSHYEEVLAVRVRPGLLARERLPPRLAGPDIWRRRYAAINGFEETLAHEGTLVLKFFLHVSREEQRRRFLDRLETPTKRWKFSMDDVADRARWNDYMAAYQDAIRATSRPHAPWHVVPADNKWFTRLVVASAVVDAMERLDLAFPRVSGRALAALKKAERALRRERR